MPQRTREPLATRHLRSTVSRIVTSSPSTLRASTWVLLSCACSGDGASSVTPTSAHTPAASKPTSQRSNLLIDASSTLDHVLGHRLVDHRAFELRELVVVLAQVLAHLRRERRVELI